MILTSTEAADILKISIKELYILVKENKIYAKKIGVKYYFISNEVYKMVNIEIIESQMNNV